MHYRPGASSLVTVALSRVRILTSCQSMHIPRCVYLLFRNSYCQLNLDKDLPEGLRQRDHSQNQIRIHTDSYYGIRMEGAD